MTQTTTTPIATIMIVDDSPANLSLLGGLFREHGYNVRPFTKASLALMGASKEAPDLFLLDINMPEMDGYELCRRLKGIPALAPIPIIFLSTLKDTEDKMKAFSAGAVDYVTKQPFHFEEILARVSTHLRLRELQRELENRNQKLQENYQKLKHLEEMKDSLTHMIVHDMRSPLTVVTMALDMVEQSGQLLEPQDKENLRSAYNAAFSLVEMTTLLLDIGRLESGKMPLNLEIHELSLLIKGCLQALAPLLAPYDLSFVHEDGLHVSNCDATVIQRIIQNLLGNAIKFTPKGAPISIHLDRAEGMLRIRIQDSGPGIPEEERSLVFEKFGQGQAGRKAQGTGLGLAFCRLAVEAHKGHIGVDCKPGQGACFWFTLPECTN